MNYNWNEDTVDHFKFESFYESREKIEQRIKEFVLDKFVGKTRFS